VAQLEQKLKILKHEHADVSLYLRADREVPYGIVVQVMDGVKKAGIEKIGMVTEPLGAERVGGSSIPRAPSRKS
ncbi:MAG TPA: biopolymer transporter ExbD, partial [Nitrospira sp.]|nr:biopolymer transporter ExbD [Nitrospira sp.]